MSNQIIFVNVNEKKAGGWMERKSFSLLRISSCVAKATYLMVHFIVNLIMIKYTINRKIKYTINKISNILKYPFNN